MQVGKLIELVQTELAGGNMTRDARKKYHPAIIKERIGTIYDKLVVPVYNSFRLRKDWSMLDKLTLPYYDQEVLTEDKVSFVYIPDTVDENNILYVFMSPAKNRDISYQRISVGQLSVYANSFVNMVDTGITAYYKEGRKLIFDKKPEVEKVTLNIISSFGSYELNDDVPMIQYMQEDLFTSTINSLRGQQAVQLDLKNNSNPTTQVNEQGRR